MIVVDANLDEEAVEVDKANGLDETNEANVANIANLDNKANKASLTNEVNDAVKSDVGNKIDLSGKAE